MKCSGPSTRGTSRRSRLSWRRSVGSASATGGFFASIAALEHEIAERWEVPGGWVVHGVVSYTRQDGSVLTVPFAILLKTATAGITEYLIFADTSELYR